MKKKYIKIFLILSLIIGGFWLEFTDGISASPGGVVWETKSSEAANYLERAISKMEGAINTYAGVNYPNKELWKEAIDYGERAIEADPNFIEAHYYLALIYQYTNWYYREAIAWGKYIELIQNRIVISTEAKQKLAFAYYRLGYAAYQREDFNDCILYLQEAVKTNPIMIEAYYWLGRVFYEEDNLNNSLSSWRKVLEIDPYYPRAQYFFVKVENALKYGKKSYEHYELGYNLYEQKLFEKAISEYRQAVNYNPSFSLAYYWLGRIYYERGNYQEAANNWKVVLRLEPENKQAEYWLKEAEKQLK